LKEHLNCCKLLVLGNTNAGKSTFLNSLIGCGNFLITNEMRETSCLWKIKFHLEEVFYLTAEYYVQDIKKRFKFVQADTFENFQE